ncbi:hypothetical protein DdX_13920 [Ditylenchus destructor]|uniref:Uncharacterized protein n=1 Tax=Ditylenchus destructor TaxID=166010 RepID=A0AAD4MTP2_9BILA|nr:hypothetical protein DdX_13920 [Ditylenchus destructor]
MFVCFVKKIFLLAAIIPITKCEIACFYEDLASVDISNITDCERIVVGWVSFDPEGYTRFSGAKHYGQALLTLLRLTSLAHKSDPPTKVLIGVTSVQYGSTAANDEYVDQETIFGYLSALVLNANSDGFIFVLPEEEIYLLLTVNPTAHTFWKSIYLRMKSGSEKMQSAAHTLAISPKLLVDTASFNTTAIVESFSSIMLFDRHKILMCNESGALPKFEVVNASSEQAGPVYIAKGKLGSYGVDESQIEIALERTQCKTTDDNEISSFMSPCEAASFLNTIASGNGNGESHTSSQRCPPPARNGCQFICTFSTVEHFWQNTGVIDFTKIGLQSSMCTHVVIRGGTIYDHGTGHALAKSAVIFRALLLFGRTIAQNAPLGILSRESSLSSTVDFDKSVKNAVKWLASITDNNIKPKLLVGYGDSSPLRTWDGAVSNDNRIQKLAKNLFEAVTLREADGIEITFPQDARLEGENVLTTSLENRLLRLIKAVRVLALQSQTDMVIVANLNHGIRRAFASELQIYADLIVIPSDRLTRFGEVTHRSHLLESTADSKLGHRVTHMPNIEKLLESFVQLGIPKGKLILSLNVHSSAVSFDIHLPDDDWDGSKDLGAPSNRINNWHAPNNRPPALIHKFYTKDKATFQSVQRSHEPYLHDREFLCSFDNLKSIRTKAIWSSMQDVAGWAVVNLQSDTSPNPELSQLGLNLEPNDRSLNRGPFLLLRQLRNFATCRKDCYRSTAALTRCGKLAEYDSFQAICFFKLRPMQNPPHSDQEINAAVLPYTKCDGVVLENFATINCKLSAPVQDCSLKSLHTMMDCETQEQLLATNARKAGIEHTAMFRLAMTAADFNSLMVNAQEMDDFISRIAYSLQINDNRQLFSGLLLNLAAVENSADLLKSAAEKRGFISFLQKLTSALPSSAYVPGKRCQFSLDLMFAALPKFDPKINLPAIASFESMIRFIFVDGQHIPFFGLASDESSISKTLESWQEVKSKIILNARSSLDVTDGKQKNVNYGRVCSNSEDFNLETGQEKRERGTSTVYYESEATLRIKANYISENGYRGVSVSVDGDDHRNLCGGNGFPLLSAIQNYRC